MGPGNNEFGQVREYLERQQRRIAELESENHTLRRELDELRRGIGIAVMIHGRTVPLAPLPPAGTAAHPRIPVTGSGEHPAASTAPSSAIPSASSSAAPVAQPESAPLAPPQATAFPEASWLTGSQPAIRAQPRAARAPEPWQARALRPSERITPEWLREATASQAPANVPQDTWEGGYPTGASGATPSQAPAPPSRHPASAPQPGELPTSRASRSRRSQASAPLPPLPLPSEPPYPSLAQLTGRQPDVQRTARRHAGERNPFDDSFVLG
jgi:hypothetical protein